MNAFQRALLKAVGLGFLTEWISDQSLPPRGVRVQWSMENYTNDAGEQVKLDLGEIDAILKKDRAYMLDDLKRRLGVR